MLFSVVINLLGVITASGSNAMYPSYSNHSTYAFHEVNDGPAFIDTLGNLYISRFDLEVTADLYFNGVDDYYIDNIGLDLNVSHYLVDDNESYVDSFSYEIEPDLSSYEITNNNIEASGYFVLQLDYEDIIYWKITTPLESRPGYYIDGSTSIVREAAPYFSYQYLLSFQNGFKQNVERYIRSSLDNNTIYNDAYNDGYTNGYQNGYDDGSGDAYQNGYADGFADADNQDAVAVTIFTGICEVGLLPVNVFLGMLNFEVFGINIGGFVASLMTVAIVVIVIRIFLGGNKSND